MATIESVYKMIRLGHNAAEILNELQIPPSRLWEIMDSRRMVKLIALNERVTQVGMRLTATTNGLKAAGRLAEMSEGYNPGLAQRACVHLLEQVRKTEQQGTGYGVLGTEQRQGTGYGVLGTGEKKQTQRQKQQQKQQQQLETAQHAQVLGVASHAQREVPLQTIQLQTGERVTGYGEGVGNNVSRDINSGWEGLTLSLGRLDSFGNVDICCETLRNVEGLGGTLRLVEKRLDAGGAEGDLESENEWRNDV